MHVVVIVPVLVFEILFALNLLPFIFAIAKTGLWNINWGKLIIKHTVRMRM